MHAMKSGLLLFGSMVVMGSVAIGGCSSGREDEPDKGAMGGGGSGGSTAGSGGQDDVGGAAGSGGQDDVGGAAGSGGQDDVGGAAGSGGQDDVGGAAGAGGQDGSCSMKSLEEACQQRSCRATPEAVEGIICTPDEVSEITSVKTTCGATRVTVECGWASERYYFDSSSTLVAYRSGTDTGDCKVWGTIPCDEEAGAGGAGGADNNAGAGGQGMERHVPESLTSARRHREPAPLT